MFLPLLSCHGQCLALLPSRPEPGWILQVLFTTSPQEFGAKPPSLFLFPLGASSVDPVLPVTPKVGGSLGNALSLLEALSGHQVLAVNSKGSVPSPVVTPWGTLTLKVTPSAEMLHSQLQIPPLPGFYSLTGMN